MNVIPLEQTLQDLRIAEQVTPAGNTWHSMTVEEIEEIKRTFIKAGFKPPTGPAQAMPGQQYYDNFKKELTEYVGDALNKNQFDNFVFDEILRRARVAAGLELP